MRRAPVAWFAVGFTMMSKFRLHLRRPQYRLRTLLLLFVVLSLPLAVWTHREHQHRIQVAAYRVLRREGARCYVLTDCYNCGAGYDSEIADYNHCRELLRGDVLRRDDVVVGVDVWGLPVSDDDVLSAIMCFPSLKALDFRQTSTSERRFGEIAKLRSLEALHLNDTGITDLTLRHLSALRSMRLLNLRHTKISSAAPAYLSSMRQLEILVLAAHNIGDESLRHLAGLPRLRVLSLSETRVTDKGLATLRPLKSLQFLDLDECLISDAGLAELADFHTLTGLVLSRTRVSDKGLATLRRLKSLDFLDLEDCAISDAGVAQLCEMTSLRTVGLTGTSVTSAGVARLRSMNPKIDGDWPEGTVPEDHDEGGVEARRRAEEDLPYRARN